MTSKTYIHDINDGLRLEIPYRTESGVTVLEPEAKAYIYGYSAAEFLFLPLRGILDTWEINAIKEKIDANHSSAR